MTDQEHAPVIDPTPGAETMRRFQIAHLIHDRTATEMAEKLGVSERTVQRWIKTGIDDWCTADDFALKVLDSHPTVVWGFDWDDAADAGLDLSPTLFDL